MDPNRLRQLALAALASMSLNMLLVTWLTRAANTHPASLTPQPSPITVELVEEAPATPTTEDPAPNPTPVLKVQPETPPITEAPLSAAPPETRSRDAAAGAEASSVMLPPKPVETPKSEATQTIQRSGATDIPDEWTVNRDGATLEELGTSPFFPAPQSGAGETGDASGLRRVLNEAACADLQLALKLGEKCPPVGAYARYGGRDTRLVSEAHAKRLQLSFPPNWLERSKPVMDTYGALPQPVGENFSHHKQGASSGMGGTLPNPDAHPYSQ